MERNVYFKISTYISADISLLIHVHSTSTFYSPAQSALVQVCIYTLHNIKSNMQWPLSAQSDVWCHHNAQPDVSVSPLSNVLKSHFSYYDHSHPASCTLGRARQLHMTRWIWSVFVPWQVGEIGNQGTWAELVLVSGMSGIQIYISILSILSTAI